MNVMNLFEENAQWRKPLAVPPAPYTETPNIDAQVHNAFGDAPQFDANAPFVPVQPEPSYEERLKSKMDEGMRLYGNPLYNLIDKGTPPLDEKRQQRLKLAAGINAFGQGISTLYGGYIGSKGGPILEQTNNFTPAALQEYNARIDADKQAKYRNALAKFQFGQNVFGQTQRQMEVESQVKANKEIAAAHDKALVEAKKYTEKTGQSFEEESALLNQKYDRMDQHAQLGYMYRTKLDSIKNDNSLSLAEKKFEFAKALEEYKASIKTVTEDKEAYKDGEVVKTRTETKIAPPVEPLKPNQNASRKPTQPAKSKGKYEIQTW